MHKQFLSNLCFACLKTIKMCSLHLVASAISNFDLNQ